MAEKKKGRKQGRGERKENSTGKGEKKNSNCPGSCGVLWVLC